MPRLLTLTRKSRASVPFCRTPWIHRHAIVAAGWMMLCVAAAPCWAQSQSPGARPASPRETEIALKIPAPADYHPLLPAIELATQGYDHIRRDIRDYACVMIRRERVDGVLGDHEFIFAKVRHRQMDGDKVVVPFSVYLKFLKPKAVRGREVLYVEGQNNNEMFVRRGGTRFAYVTTRISPTSDLAMRGNRYPITEFGIENLVRRLLDASRQALAVPCEVQFLKDSRVNDRPCRAIVVTHGHPSEVSPFFQVRIFIDEELNVPIHYEAYDWPAEQGGSPQLVEQYTYTQLQLNVGFTNSDFDSENPQYRLR